MSKYRINTKFKNSNGEIFDLYSISVDESVDDIQIITQTRQPSLKRGCVGDLMLTSRSGLDGELIEDVHRDILLRRIEVWSDDPDYVPEWKYVFLKD